MVCYYISVMSCMDARTEDIKKANSRTSSKFYLTTKAKPRDMYTGELVKLHCQHFQLTAQQHTRRSQRESDRAALIYSHWHRKRLAGADDDADLPQGGTEGHAGMNTCLPSVIIICSSTRQCQQCGDGRW